MHNWRFDTRACDSNHDVCTLCSGLCGVHAAVNKELITRHRVYEQVVDIDLPLCPPEVPEKNVLGVLYVPLVRVALIEASLVLEVLQRDRHLVSVNRHT